MHIMVLRTKSNLKTLDSYVWKEISCDITWMDRALAIEERFIKLRERKRLYYHEIEVYFEPPTNKSVECIVVLKRSHIEGVPPFMISKIKEFQKLDTKLLSFVEIVCMYEERSSLISF